MTLEEALWSYLQADSGVTGLIGTSLFPNDAPPGQAAPYVCYERTDTIRPASLQQDARQPTADIDLHCYGTNKANASAIAKAVRESEGGLGGPAQLTEFRGLMGFSPGVLVQGTWIQGGGESGGAVATQDASGAPAYVQTVSLRITYVEQA